jgi:serine/threonine-protein kinase
MVNIIEEDLNVYFKGRKVTLEQRLREDRLNFIGITETGERYFVKLSCKKDPNMLREKQALELIVDKGGHPNVLSEFDSGEANNELDYLVSPIDIEDMTLSGKYRKYDSSSGEIYEIFLCVCNGLEYLHKNGIIHRDIKPSNLIVKPDNKNAFIIDFGFAIIKNNFSLDIPGFVLGSPFYVAPEIWVGDKYSVQSDIYALGISLYEISTGRVPFNHSRTSSLALAHIKEPLIDPCELDKDIPVSLSKVIKKALEKDPSQRFKSASEFAKELFKSLTYKHWTETLSLYFKK